MREWRSPERTILPEWDAAFDLVFRSGDQEAVVCPACHQAPLRVFFLRHGADNHGSYWIWCPSCLRFDHGTGLVPSWWQDVGNVDSSLLTPEPEWLEDHWNELAARRRSE